MSHETKKHTKWGHIEYLLQTGKYVVKKITVKPHHTIPEEYHQQRDEHWVVIQGESVITLPHAKRISKAGDSMYIPRRNETFNLQYGFTAFGVYRNTNWRLFRRGGCNIHTRK